MSLVKLVKIYDGISDYPLTILCKSSYLEGLKQLTGYNKNDDLIDAINHLTNEGLIVSTLSTDDNIIINKDVYLPRELTKKQEEVYENIIDNFEIHSNPESKLNSIKQDMKIIYKVKGRK